MQSLSWDNFRFILAIYRYQTIAAAARELGVNETTVSRRLAQTEKYLHCKLFSRRPNGLIPTESGVCLMQRIESVKVAFDEVELQASQGQREVVGTVRIACDSVLMNHMVVPQLSRVLNEYPELKIELLTTACKERLRDADITIGFHSKPT